MTTAVCHTPVTTVYHTPVTTVYHKPVTTVYHKPVTTVYHTPVTTVYHTPVTTVYRTCVKQCSMHSHSSPLIVCVGVLMQYRLCRIRRGAHLCNVHKCT